MLSLVNTVNLDGAVGHWISLMCISDESPIYLVFFKDHSKYDPYCEPLDLTNEVTFISGKGKPITYEKVIGDFTCRCSVSTDDKQLDWHIQLLGNYPRQHRFGIAIPIGEDPNFHTLDGIPRLIRSSLFNQTSAQTSVLTDGLCSNTRPMATYCSEDIDRQHKLSCPIVSTQFDQELLSVFTPPDYHSQFFAYWEEAANMTYLRVTTVTDLTSEFHVTIKIHEDHDNYHVYTDKYKSSNRGKKYEPSKESVDPQAFLKVVQNGLEKLASPYMATTQPPTTAYDATAWMDLVRTARQTEEFWEIPYVKPLPIMESINNLIKDSELMLYGNEMSLDLEQGYTADIYQEVAFHTIRAHLKAEDGILAGAFGMFQELYYQWMKKIPPIRQSNLMMHYFVACLCYNGKYRESQDVFKKHQALMNKTSKKNQTELGISDNHVIMQCLSWYFAKHLELYRNLMANGNPHRYWRHKRVPMANFLTPAWAASFCGKGFYDNACRDNPELPRIGD